MIGGARVRLNGWQQAAVALGSAVGALLDPRRADLIAALGETTGKPAFERVLERMKRSSEGRAVFLERPRIISANVGHAWELPTNTFGAAYAKFMGSRNFSPDDRPPVWFMETEELVYVAMRAREVHDFWHTLFEVLTNLIRESALKVIEFQQMHLPMCFMSVIGGSARFSPKQRSLFFQHYFPWALRAGISYTDLMCIYYERHFDKEMDEVRRKCDETEGDMVIKEWEDEDEEWEDADEADPEIGDGGAGGGIVLQYVPWGERALSIAHEVLLQFGDDIKLFSFKTTPRGYIYIRLDKIANEYGCPSMEEIESYSKQYKKRLEEEGSKGHIPEDLALEVSSPGAERLLRVPEDLHRFKDYPMVVAYIDTEAKGQEKSGVLFLDSIDAENELSIWKLADVKENQDPARKGRPMSRKQKDWRLKLPYSMLKKVTFYLEF